MTLFLTYLHISFRYGLIEDNWILRSPSALNLLQHFVVAYEKNLASNRYRAGEESVILIAVWDNCGCSF